MTKEEENLLIEEAKHGSEQAFTQLYNNYYKLIRYIIFDLVKDDEITADLVSVTFTKAFKRLDSYINPISFEAWLKTIAVNTVIDHVRANKDENKNYSIDNEDSAIQVESEDNDPETAFIRAESIDILRIALTRLRSKYRNLLELRYFNGLSYEELSAELNIPIGTVKSDLNKAKHKLKYFFQKLSKTNKL